MKNSIIILLSIFLYSCSSNPNTIEITQEEYKQLKGDTVKPEYPKPFKFKEPDFAANWKEWAIIQGEDNHEYLVNNGGQSFAFIHYPDCKLCKERNNGNKN